MQGGLVSMENSGPPLNGARFQPSGLKLSFGNKLEGLLSYTVALDAIAHACMDCGLVWSHSEPSEIRQCIAAHSGGTTDDNRAGSALCPKCGNSIFVSGGLFLRIRYGWAEDAFFRPDGLKWWSFTPFGAGPKLEKGAIVCMNCGLVKAHIIAFELREFVSKHCKAQSRDKFADSDG